jgi:hypothetical protein
MMKKGSPPHVLYGTSYLGNDGRINYLLFARETHESYGGRGGNACEGRISFVILESDLILRLKGRLTSPHVPPLREWL